MEKHKYACKDIVKQFKIAISDFLFQVYLTTPLCTHHVFFKVRTVWCTCHINFQTHLWMIRGLFSSLLIQPQYNYRDFKGKEVWSCTSIQQLQETMWKIKTEYVLPFVRDGAKSQEYSLRPLCPVWNSAVKGFSCGHLSGRDIMILQLETESWDLFISPNSSPPCAEHIKYYSGGKNKLFAHRNYRSINSFTTMTSRAIHIIFYSEEQYRSTVNVSIKGCIYTSSVTSCISKMALPLQINYTFSLTRMVWVLLILNGFPDTSLLL